MASPIAHQAGSNRMRTYKEPVNNLGTVTQRIVRAVLTVICMLLAIRFVLALFGATEANAIVQTIYTVSAPLIAPFRSLFDNEPTLGAARFEIETLLAIITYLLLGTGILYVLGRQQN